MKQDHRALAMAEGGRLARGKVGSGDRALLSRRVTRVAESLAVVLVGMLEIGCDRYRHGLRRGTLAEVELPTLSIFVVDQDHWKLAIGNEAKDGTCLEMRALRVTIDGVAQTSTMGGRTSGQTKGSFGPVDRTDWCESAVADLVVPDRPARLADVVEVTDGTAAIRAEFPNVLSHAVWVKPPPRSARAGSTFEVRLQPALAVGSDADDPPNLVGVWFDAPGTSIKLESRFLGGDRIAVTAPSTGTPRKGGTLRLVSTQHGVAARSCTARSCTTWTQVAIEYPLDVEP
ncbi:MAG: hypothetical protein ABJE95_29385 [Byssovorax sp.]